MASTWNLTGIPSYEHSGQGGGNGAASGIMDSNHIGIINLDPNGTSGDVPADPGAELASGSGFAAMELQRPALLKQSVGWIALLTTVYGLVFLLAVINNILVITAIYRTPQLRTVTNMFLANLAVADITVSIFVLPITLLNNLFTEWLFSPFLCKAIPYLQAVAVGASVNTLAAVAVERYLAIFHSQTRAITANMAIIVISVIWLIPVCIQIPWAMYTQQATFVVSGVQNTVCYGKYPSTNFERGFFLGGLFLTCYLIPLCFLTVFYSLIGVRVWKRSVAGIKGSKAERSINRSKIRIVRMLIVVTVIFALSWLPVYSLRLWWWYGPSMSGEQKQQLGLHVVPLAQLLGSANSCANPFIYCYFSEQFRRAILTVFRGCPCCQKLLERRGSVGQPTCTSKVDL